MDEASQTGGRSRGAFIGRGPEREKLAARVAAAAAGCGQVVLVCGEPGIRKTRLAEQSVVAATSAGMRCCWGRAVEDEGCPPYWLFRQVLRAVAGADDAALPLPPGPAAAQEVGSLDPRGRFGWFESVTDALVAASTSAGLLVVFDDLQWADPGSLQLLVHLVRRVDGSRLLVLATYRDTEIGGRDDLRRALAREPMVDRVRLVGLAEQEVAAQLADVTGGPVAAEVAAVVGRRSRGNPFFVAELGRALTDPSAGPGALPEGVRDAVCDRLARLSGPCRELVAAAAELGSDVDPTALAAATAAPVEDVLSALDEAVAAGVVVDGRFAHDLVRESARLELPITKRLRLHLQMTEYLAHRTDARSRVVEIAHHHLAALPLGDAAAAARWGKRAAEQAMAELAWEQAAELFGRALAAAEHHLSSADRCAMLLARARAHVLAYDLAAARQAVLAAADLARDLGDAELLARAAVTLEGTADFAWARAGRALCAEALAGLPDRDTMLRARLLAQLAVDHSMSFMREGDVEGAQLSAEALAMAERIGEHPALVAALRARQIACGGPSGARERLQVARRMLSLGEDGADDEAVLWGRLWRFDALIQLGEIDRAEGELGAIETAARRLRSPLARWHLLRSRGAIAYGRGRFDEALELGIESVALAERAGHGSILLAPLASLALVCSQTGRNDLPVFPSPQDWPGGDALAGSAVLWYLAIGRLEDARLLYLALPGPQQAPVYALLPYLAAYADMADAFDDPETAAQVYTRLRPYADLFVCSGLGALGTSGSVQLPLGVAAATLGRLDEAARHLRAAVEIDDRADLPPFAATARYQLARVLARRRRPGDRDEAVALAVAAARSADALGMIPLARRAREFAATLTGSGPGQLTPREREIAALVTQGLTNRQIAATAHISERTVEDHIQHILGKLGFTNRTQIAAWATRNDSPLGMAGSTPSGSGG